MNNKTQKTIKWMMITLSFIICHLSFTPARAQTGSWRTYMPYYEPQQIVKGGNLLYVRASNALYTYNLNDQSIETYDKIRQLNDTYITHIAWNKEQSKLIVVYQNSNIDLLDRQGEVTNISALYTKTMTQDKTINAVYMADKYAYLATNFGIVKLNMQREEIAESYILNMAINAIGISGDNIYARTKQGNVITALLTQNLINPASWTTAETTPANVFEQDNTDWQENIDLVRTLKPGGPKYNQFKKIIFQNQRLYACSGQTTPVNTSSIQIMENDEWTVIDKDLKDITGIGNRLNQVYDLDIDPADPNHLFVASQIGLAEFKDGELTQFYDQDNSPIETALHPNNYPVSVLREYNLVTSVRLDHKGNLWCLNSQALTQGLLRLDLDSRQWTSYPWDELMQLSSEGINNKSLGNLVELIFDSRGYGWFVNDHWNKPGIFGFYLDDNGTLHKKSIFDLTNQNGTALTAGGGIKCIAEDLNGDLWVGVSDGLLLLPQDQIEAEKPVFTQVTVPRNDGSDLADYLMDGMEINCIAIDAGNRKWIGTQNNGLYLISADNMTQLHHFTTEDSPLLSNTVKSLTIDNETGEVFISTESGLCSYLADATTSAVEMKKDDVYAFPNPVPSGYNGLITVRGLSFDADVKVLTTSCTLVAQGRSNGGTFTWNGLDLKGRRVASGIYMIVTAKSNGEKGTVCKIAIIR